MGRVEQQEVKEIGYHDRFLSSADVIECTALKYYKKSLTVIVLVSSKCVLEGHINSYYAFFYA